MIIPRHFTTKLSSPIEKKQTYDAVCKSGQKKALTAEYFERAKKKIFSRYAQNEQCFVCKKITKDWHVEHFIICELSKKGVIRGVVCRSCNALEAHINKSFKKLIKISYPSSTEALHSFDKQKITLAEINDKHTTARNFIIDKLIPTYYSIFHRRLRELYPDKHNDLMDLDYGKNCMYIDIRTLE